MHCPGWVLRKMPFHSMRYWILAVLLGGFVSGEAHQDEGHDEIRAFRVQPVVLDPKTQGIGRIVEDFELVDIHDKPHRLSTLLADAKAVVIAVRDVKCPVSSKYAPVLSRMEKIYAAHGIQFLFLNPNRHDDKRSILKEIEAHGLDSPYVADPSGRIASILGAQSSSQVLVVDKRRRVVYDGAVDDQYGIGYARSAPLRSYLRDALNSLAGGRPITVSATSAPGCFINPNPEMVESNELTYYRDVAPIVQENCQVCHRPGESGPFPLLSFYDVSGRKEMIRYVLQNRIMPPWFAAPGAGPWKNDRTLAVTERETFLRWIDNGAPAGDIEDAPDPVQWPVGWRMGEPDLVLALPKVFDIPAEGQLPYEYVTISPGLTQDKWVNGLEIRLDAPQLVHHILVFLVPPGYQPSDDIFSHDSPPFFAAYSPGLGPQVFTEGLARRLPRDKDLLFQIHYQPNGTPGRDTPRLGLRFHPEEPLHEVHAGTIGSYAIT